MFSNILEQSHSFFSKNKASDLIAKFSIELADIETALVFALPPLVECILVVIGCLLTISVFDWRIALVATALIPLSYLSAVKLGPWVSHYAIGKINAESKLLATLQDAINGRNTIRAFGAEHKINDSFSHHNTVLQKASSGYVYNASLIPLFSLYSVNIILVLMVGTGAAFVIDQELSLGSFFGCITLLGSVAAGTNSAIKFYAIVMSIQHKVMDIEHYLEVGGMRNQGTPNPSSFVPRDCINFKQVSFQYPDGDLVLNNVSFDIEIGSSVAIVGETGSGKSTLIHLLTGFYEPTMGSISIDGVDIKAIHKTSLRNTCGIVFQDAYLLNTTIKENILLGKADASDEDVTQAAKKAQIHDYIESLPLKYNFMIEDNGSKLSGGQKQRLAIARAIVRKPNLLILDESTSALDANTEASIVQDIYRIKQDMTIVAITHRLNTIKEFNKIIVLNKGSVVEEGQHFELLQKQGHYFNMWRNQMTHKEFH
jgi:ATP-binding cassette subfamily B protein